MKNRLEQLLTEIGNAAFVPIQLFDRTIWVP